MSIKTKGSRSTIGLCKGKAIELREVMLVAKHNPSTVSKQMKVSINSTYDFRIIKKFEMVFTTIYAFNVFFNENEEIGNGKWRHSNFV